MGKMAPTELKVWNQCREAAIAALKAKEDPTNGAIHMNMREATQPYPETRAHKWFGEVSTSHGPFINDAGEGDLGKGEMYINTYYGKESQNR